ncbi:hypothetical protein GCM10007938_12650 [Vibrio zhanjiangensis]|uniref:Uncharacterized protein n=1 Tax=Vibrio zhanjiangensis TaxID=1046128 RepID=A0ABQ6EWF9_9VIBR|nr:hypothetical protein [Vibrio zhanjiangensis]GLT17488.1 hypothetical protein GCM10007938_12650 [Vibrio zhanjiangensis]
MRTFNILKKEKDFFLASTGKSHCKIIIDDYSSELPFGEVTLHVEEVSNKYKYYSNEAIFKLTLPLDEQNNIDICTLSSGRKNQFVYKKCLKLGGKWEPILNQWVFSSSVEDKVRELENIIHGEEEYCEVTFKETVTIHNQELTLFGYPIISSINATSINTVKGVKLHSGNIAVLGTKTIVVAGTRVRLFVPKLMREHQGFREDYLCATLTDKKRKPNKKRAYSWE